MKLTVTNVFFSKRGKVLSVSNEEKSQTNNDNIDPRVGFAYSKEGKLNSSQVYILGKTTRLFWI